MKPGLEIGAVHEHRMEVAPYQTVRQLFGEHDAFPDMPDVFATAFYTGLMEWGCVELIRPFYDEGEQSLGTHVDFTHTAPTLPGQVVTVTARLDEFDGKFFWFTVSAHDGVDLIGQGRHQRALISTERFMDRLAKKRAKAGLEAA